MNPIEEEINDDIAVEIRKNMETIVKYYDSINTKIINFEKQLNNLKYLLELKKAKSIINNEDDKKYEQKQKMYLSKLNKKEILNPKESTLQYYKIKFSEDKYII